MSIQPTSSHLTGHESVKIQKFSMRLKKSVRDMHEKVSRHKFVYNLMQKKVNKEKYCQYLANLYCLYDILEHELDSHKDDPKLVGICIPSIYRTEALKKDLEKLKGLETKPTESLEKYRVHIASISSYKPYLLVAHAYTRYMGDLFGGQQMGKVVGEKWQGATHFYTFGDLYKEFEVKNPMRFVTKYRQRLDSLKLTQKEQQDVIDEVKVAFDFADKILSELD